MKTTPSSVIEKMTTMDDNPLDFDDMVSTWNAFCDESWSEHAEDFQFADIKSAAISVLSDDRDVGGSRQIGNEISRMLSTFEYPAILVGSNARVAAANTAALKEFDLDFGDKIDQLPYSLDSAQNISELIKKSLNSTEADPAGVVLKRAFGIGNEREATIAITTSIAKVSTALVFVISTQWKSSSAELIKRQFALTNTETEVLISFVNGYSSKDIAKQRKRSHATVRTQFQTILAKTGARNQSELLRICLSVSDFVGKIDVITDAVNHPHRRRSEVLRKGGRRVEVTIAGDVSGDPIVSIAQLTHYTFTAEFEQYLFDAKLYIINVCPPSYGRTDPIAENASRIDHTCDDVIAVLDQLEVDSCPVLATHTNGPYVYALANSRPERINSVAQISAIGPIKFAQNSESCSSWMTGIVRACHTHGALKRIIIRGAVRSMVTLGSKQFMRIQVTSKPIDAEYVLRPENIKEYQHAMTAATHGGLASAVTDCILAFGDWTDHIESMNQHITIIHGGEDGLFAIESVRAFAAEFPDKITVIEISEAGFSLAYSHAKEAVAILRSLVDKQQLNDLPVT